MGTQSWIASLFPTGHKGHFPYPLTNELQQATVTGHETAQDGRVTGVHVVFHGDGKWAAIGWIALNLLIAEGQVSQ